MDILREYHSHLGRMKTAFQQLPTPYVSSSDLSTLGVQLSHMSLQPADTIDAGPSFLQAISSPINSTTCTKKLKNQRGLSPLHILTVTYMKATDWSIGFPS